MLQWLTPEGFRSLIALVGTNGQGVGTSAISVWVRNCTGLDLPPDEHEKLDQLINQLYDDLEKGAYHTRSREFSVMSLMFAVSFS